MPVKAPVAAKKKEESEDEVVTLLHRLVEASSYLKELSNRVYFLFVFRITMLSLQRLLLLRRKRNLVIAQNLTLSQILILMK